MTLAADDVLSFWIDEIGPEGWYTSDPELDARIRSRFLDAWEDARHGGYDHWSGKPRTCLALLILLDQFPRNMFRDDPRAFATDAKALAVAKTAIDRGFDRRVEAPERQFFYLPLMHSERIADQARSVRLFLLHMGNRDSLVHARAHRWVIRRFGRFPYRNDALGRRSTPEEADFLTQGGYAAAMSAVA